MVKITVVHFQNYKADLEISRTEQYTLTLEVLLAMNRGRGIND